MTTLTPADAALLELADHCVNCPDCRTVWKGNDEPIQGSCPTGDELSRQALRARRRTEVHPS